MRENLFFSKILTKSESVRFGTVSSPRPLQQFNWKEPGALWKGDFQHLRGYFRVSLWRFGQNGRMMRRLPMLRFFKWSSCGRNTSENVDHHCCFERLPLASWGCRTCSSRRASWPAGFRGAPADCSPASHLSSPRPTWSAQHNITKVNPTATQPPNSKR